MTDQSFAYVLALNNGNGGHSPPVQVFLRENEAKAVLFLMGPGWEIYRVPMWPQAAIYPWHSLEPVKFLPSRQPEETKSCT